MVSGVHSFDLVAGGAEVLAQMGGGLPAEGRTRIEAALTLARSAYGQTLLGTGEATLQHALGMALIAASLDLDADVRVAALLFAAPEHVKQSADQINAGFGAAVAALVSGLHRLGTLRPLTRAVSESPASRAQTAAKIQPQIEILRKMLLAMTDDIRVVLLRLASRVQTLRYLSGHPGSGRDEMARESLLIYAPLANRLGVWQLKWELEDLSFRYLEPIAYKRIASQLDQTRREREVFIESAASRLKSELAAIGVQAEVYGRPKHIVSIWHKMRNKGLKFEQLYDLRAMRVLVEDTHACYAALGVVHHLWQPIDGEFDDYIVQPKANFYQSLHTAVRVEDGRSLEVQIRTREMHEHAELGIAAHWRYKEGAATGKTAGKKAGDAGGNYDDKIAWLRQLLSWRDEITDSADWAQQFKRAALDDTIYVLTPQDKVIDLPRGATGLDFAYRLHTDLGHRCRGVRIDGHMVPLNTPLQSGQRVEIITAKAGGPSRDWLNPTAGYLVTARARLKAKRWFTSQEESESLGQGRAIVIREMQRQGQTHAKLDELAAKLGMPSADALFLAAARGEVGPRAIEVALHGAVEAAPELPEIQARKSRAGLDSGRQGILVVGVDRLLTQLGRCCKPMPPDLITGFVTRGKGVSIHRLQCANFHNMATRNPERVIACEWGNRAVAADSGKNVYATDIVIEAADRQGLLRDVSDVLSREKINVTAVNSQTKAGLARMCLTIELPDAEALGNALHLLNQVRGVANVKRR